MFISIEQSGSLDQSLQPHMEENLEDRIHPVHVEESNENTGSEIEDYFSDSSEEFNDAERIKNSTYENEVESNRHHEDNSNIDSSDSDSEDTSGLNNPFFSVNTPTFNFPFISKPNLTENDHLLAILAISTRNNFSFEAMLSIFTWIKITHTNNNLPTTKKALWKVLHRDDTLIKRHLYCGVCKEHIGVDEEMRRDMLAAYETKTIINGIKGISALSGLPEFDLANGLAVDSLHAVFFRSCKTAYEFIFHCNRFTILCW
ncbi:hypothetical protein KQX54_013370 [Cotesia glomerata]|uniref:Uncharacterized protein n=1 Tax=Cotesia glomerata TaxID=32391 RepID=A0AAV7I7K2_COTGL|nr:hypothetical protein KQX54_013370 [Cotesia glomerata]